MYIMCVDLMMKSEKYFIGIANLKKQTKKQSIHFNSSKFHLRKQLDQCRCIEKYA